MRSHQKAIAAQKGGLFTDEMTPIDMHREVPESGTQVNWISAWCSVNLDEGPRHNPRSPRETAPCVRGQGQRDGG